MPELQAQQSMRVEGGQQHQLPPITGNSSDEAIRLWGAALSYSLGLPSWLGVRLGYYERAILRLTDRVVELERICDPNSQRPDR